MAQAVTGCRSCTPSSVAHLQQSPGLNEEVETDPSHRYLRYPLLLGRGACKRVYKAFDQVEGIEVAWNQIELLGSDMDADARERLFAEIRVLKTLQHRNIMRFYDWWYDAATATINFITEYFTSGNLRQYRKKHKHISEHAIKRWAFQILEGLMYLHAHEPPIVHRDLKCDNILVNGTSGQVKIADLGLASCRRGLSVVGTPEFMAPEIYDEVYDEKVDIYSFGMCMLELATLEYPYSECRSIPAIFRKVSQGIPPAALAKVTSRPLHDFISTCINPDPRKRPEALQLLRHNFFDSLKPDSPTGAPYINIPFGSCGNLQNLGVSGIHSKHPNCGSPRLKTPSCAECTAVSRAAKHAASGQAELQTAAHGPGHCVSCGAQVIVLSADGSTSSLGESSPKQQGQHHVQLSGRPQVLAAAAAEVNFERGRSICLAALKRSEVSACSQGCEHEEDSDDEVIVALEDVLTPHPEDLLDPATSRLQSTLRHAPSGCTIVSAPESNIESRLLELNLSSLLDTAGVDAGVAALVPGDAPSQTADSGVLGVSCSVQTLQSTDSDAASPSDAHAGADSPATGTPLSCDRAAPCVCNIRSAGSITSSMTDSCPPGMAWQSEVGVANGGDNPAGVQAIPATPSTDNSAVDTSVCTTAGSAVRPQVVRVEVIPADATAQQSPGMQISASSFSSQTQRGSLAAAGLLQMSPGVFVTTPSLLSKLLTKSSRPTPSRMAVPGLACHHRCTGSDGLGPWEIEQQWGAAGLSERQANFLQQRYGHSRRSDPMLPALAASGVHAGNQSGASLQGVDRVNGQGFVAIGDGKGRAAALRSMHDSRIAANSQRASAACWTSSITVDGSVMTDAITEAASYLSGPDCLADQPTSSSVAGCGNVLAAAAGGTAALAEGGLYGRIVVRRKFARNLQTTVTPQTRSKSL